MPWKGGCACPLGQEWEGDWRPIPGHGSWGALPAWGGRWLGWTVHACLHCCPAARTPGRVFLALGRPPWDPAPPTPTLPRGLVTGKREVVCTALRTRAVWEPRRWLTCCCVWSTDLGILLGMALGNEGLEVWPLTRSEECAITGFLRDKLQYRNRLQYMVTTWALVVSLFQSPVAHGT